MVMEIATLLDKVMKFGIKVVRWAKDGQELQSRVAPSPTFLSGWGRSWGVLFYV